MKHVIIGTAGHVDHGKTALIRTLTGIDTDRLPEEKARGLTTDLGFAHLDFPDGTQAGSWECGYAAVQLAAGKDGTVTLLESGRLVQYGPPKKQASSTS